MEAQSKKGNSQSLIAHKGKEGEDEVKKKKGNKIAYYYFRLIEKLLLIFPIIFIIIDN